MVVSLSSKTSVFLKQISFLNLSRAGLVCFLKSGTEKGLEFKFQFSSTLYSFFIAYYRINFHITISDAILHRFPICFLLSPPTHSHFSKATYPVDCLYQIRLTFHIECARRRIAVTSTIEQLERSRRTRWNLTLLSPGSRERAGRRGLGSATIQ